MIFTLNIALLSILGNHYNLIPAAAPGGLAADLLYWRLKPSPLFQIIDFISQVRFGGCAVYSTLGSHMHLAISDLEPEAASSLQ